MTKMFQAIYIPPLTCIVSPVMYDDASDARNITALATGLGIGGIAIAMASKVSLEYLIFWKYSSYR